ncbi:MAG: ABC transporter permease [Lachnospiraceae bacterium]
MQGILRSEWTKLSSYPWSILGLIGAILTAPVVLFLMGIVNRANLQTNDVLALCMRTLYLGHVGVAVTAAGLFGQEYTHSGIRTTFLAVPARMKVVAAKLIVLSISVVLAGMISAILSIAVGNFQFNGEITFNLMSEYMEHVTLAMLSWVLIAFITSNLAVLTKSLVAPIAVMISLILGLSQLLLKFFTLAKYLPDLAAMNLFLTPGTTEYLDTWAGVTVQFAWFMLLGILAVWVTMRGDVR